MSAHEESFNQLLLECVDDGLSVLGHEPQQAVYHFLLTICSLPREEVPNRVEDFASGLKKALGGASKVIERVILRKLFERTGSVFREIPDSSFNEYVADARRRFEIVSHRRDDATDSPRSKKGQVSG